MANKTHEEVWQSINRSNNRSGCGCLTLIILLLVGSCFMGEPSKTTPSQNSAPTKPAVSSYTLEQQQAAFKDWMQKTKENLTNVDNQWAYLDTILQDKNLSRGYKNLEILQSNLEGLEDVFSTAVPPKELSEEHQMLLKEANSDIAQSLAYRIKIVKAIKEYYDNQKPSVGARGLDESRQKAISASQASAGLIISKVKEDLKVKLD